MEIFSEAKGSLRALSDSLFTSNEDFDRNDSLLHSLRQRMFNKKFALEKTYWIVGDVPQTIPNTSPMVSTLVTQP